MKYLLEVVKNFTSPDSVEKIGTIPSLAILTILMIVPIFKSIYTTSIEKVFMTPKKMRVNITYSLITLFVACVLENLILSISYEIYVIGLSLGCLGGLVFLYYKFRRFQIKKVLDNVENLDNIKRLDRRYKYYKQLSFLFCLLSFVPCLLTLINNSTIKDVVVLHFSRVNCAIIIGLIELVIVCIYVPELIKNPSGLYIMYNTKKMYIYKRLDKENFLCGNNLDIDDLNEYITISYEHLKEKTISKEVVDNNLPSEEKKELKRELNRRFWGRMKEKIIYVIQRTRSFIVRNKLWLIIILIFIVYIVNNKV